jgi:hypothetical protein
MRWIVFSAVILQSSLAQASDRSFMTISQPLEGSGAGIVIAQVLYVDFYNTWLDPSTAVRLTVAENRIHTKQGPENLNTANLLGIVITPLPGELGRDGNAEYRFPGLCGDTLKVRVRVPFDSEMEYERGLNRPYARYSPAITVPATLECMKENARKPGH